MGEFDYQRDYTKPYDEALRFIDAETQTYLENRPHGIVRFDFENQTTSVVSEFAGEEYEALKWGFAHLGANSDEEIHQSIYENHQAKAMELFSGFFRDVVYIHMNTNAEIQELDQEIFDRELGKLIASFSHADIHKTVKSLGDGSGTTIDINKIEIFCKEGSPEYVHLLLRILDEDGLMTTLTMTKYRDRFLSAQRQVEVPKLELIEAMQGVDYELAVSIFGLMDVEFESDEEFEAGIEEIRQLGEEVKDLVLPAIIEKVCEHMRKEREAQQLRSAVEGDGAPSQEELDSFIEQIKTYL